MQEGAFADGSDLAITKQACERQRAEFVRDSSSVVIGDPEHALAAPITGAENASYRLKFAKCGADLQEQVLQIQIGAGGIAHLELDGLSHTGQSTNCQSAIAPIHTDELTNEKTAALKAVAILIGSQAYKQITLSTALELWR